MTSCLTTQDQNADIATMFAIYFPAIKQALDAVDADIEIAGAISVETADLVRRVRGLIQ